jgi:integrase/recombinase XerD
MLDFGNLQSRNVLSTKQRLNDSSLSIGENIGSQGTHSPSIPTVGKALNIFYSNSRNRRVCVSEGEMKNLAEVESRTEKRAAGAITQAEIKGKIVGFLWELKKQGLKDSTIQTYHLYLSTLIKRGANLLDPESVKEVIAKQRWEDKTRKLAANAYSKFLQVYGGTWAPPKCRPVRKLPFIPLECELDQLISGAYKKLATFLQLLKETGMRSGEAWRRKWTDIDFKRGTITLNEPEKYSNPRMFKISSTLIAMLNALPKKGERIFEGDLRSFGRIFRKYRSRMSFKLQNPRLKKITFHTFRHWKATTEYAKTKDILHVMKMLGHKDIKTTLIYTQLIQFESDEFHSATAKTIDEGRQLIEAGFEYVCTYNDIMLFRKRK